MNSETRSFSKLPSGFCAHGLDGFKVLKAQLVYMIWDLK